MKILLTTLNAKYIHSNLALKYLYAAAPKNRQVLTIREFTINNDDDYILTEICRGDYDTVCFSCYIWNIERTLYLAENLKKVNSKINILLGGPEVSFDAVSLLQEHEYVDYILCGEGEASFDLFLDCLQEQDWAGASSSSLSVPRSAIDFAHQCSALQDVAGLVYRQQGRIYENPLVESAFLATPFPYDFLAGEEDKIIYYESARGCPYRCSYCLSSVDKNIRALPLERVQSELRYFLHSKVKQVKFIDRTFNWDEKRALAIMQYLIAQDNGITNFHFELCGDLVSEEMITLLSKARKDLFQFEIGIQSTNPKTLEACNRHSDFQRLKHNIKKILDLKTIHVHVDLIAGLPHETYATFRRSFNDVYELGAQQLQLGFLKLLKGSPLRAQGEQYGYVYRSKPPYEVLANDSLQAKDLIRLKMIENILDLYYNRGGFAKTLEFITAVFGQSPFDFYEDFAHFYYQQGFQHQSHKKEDLYRIFLAYTKEKDLLNCGTAARIAELLTEDMKDTLNPDAIKKFNRKGWEIQ